MPVSAGWMNGMTWLRVEVVVGGQASSRRTGNESDGEAKGKKTVIS